jgi:hypothetical protein
VSVLLFKIKIARKKWKKKKRDCVWRESVCVREREREKEGV